MTTASKPGSRLSRSEAPLFVDTAGWVCLFDADQDLHREMTDVYQRAQAHHRRLVTTNYIMTETVALLGTRTRIARQRIAAYIDGLKAAPTVDIIHVGETQDAEAWALWKARLDKAWSLVDAASFVMMSTLGITEALTTDHHFLQAGFVRLPLGQPAP